MTVTILPTEAGPGQLPRRRALVFGSAYAAGASAILVLTLLGKYLEARSAAGGEWLADNGIPLTQPTMQLMTLLLSSVTVQWAVHAISRNNRSQVYGASALTLVFGLAVINQTWFLYTQIGLGIRQAEGPLFYGVTGAHLAMLGAAILFLGLNTVRALGGAMGSKHPDGFSAAALYWHVMVALYSAIWLGVYVLK